MKNVIIGGETYADINRVKLNGVDGKECVFDDTSDATATASDIASGKTAYVNGAKVTGNLPTSDLQAIITADNVTPTLSGGKLQMEYANNIENLYRKGFAVTLQKDASYFGDATAANVVSGKKFTSKNGIAVTGTHTCSAPSGTINITTNGTHNVSAYATANVNVPSSGIDTSDATAEALNVEIGKTAYVKGNKITGTLKTINNGSSYTGKNGDISYLPSTSGISAFFSVKGNPNSENVQLKSGASINFSIDAIKFGDAAAEDVAAGRTFTSKNGLKVVGTFSQQSVQTKTGTFTLDADAESYDIVTGLSKIVAFEAHTTEPGYGSGRTIFKFSIVSNNNTAILKDASGQYLTSTYANSFSGWVTGGTIKAVKLTRTSYEYLLSHGTWNWTAIGN